MALSPGQSQRLMLMALFLRSPNVVVLDECTSALDPVTERDIMASLRKHVYGQTTVLSITHRLENIAPTDRVLCLSDGMLTDDGEFQILRENGSAVFRQLTSR